MEKSTLTLIATVLIINSSIASISFKANEGWYLAGSSTPIGDSQTWALCPDEAPPVCAYHFSEGSNEPDITILSRDAD